MTFGYSVGSAISLGVARKLKEEGAKPFDAFIFVVPGFALNNDHWSTEYRTELEDKC